MNVVLIKYNAGNVQSVLYALERLGISAVVSDDADIIQSADRVIFPGVGEASTAMNYLAKTNLPDVIRSLRQPVLGICLGMQLMCSHSDENDTKCLGIFQEPVRRFKNGDDENTRFKIPQMGWNDIYDLKSPLFKNVAEHSYIYLVHSYYAARGEHTIATADYIQPFSAALQKENFYGVQFHPEKSADTGGRVLENFIRGT